ncbi:MAG: hypothetical protein WCY15_16410 [Phenylobacterium sp.]|jgi:hypothetical protein|uniref:hypothetical protein n=1 Tax=Phenylobacterium sp. TaxID=1871053 RepID=UPI002A32E5CE|nr:hypothetical protein [Phenylobacterium sp.]MDD3837101.1 hypothetical protein [Phenylobacterium sp.]MDX9999613.1 hypothetical protein [Phenylobacterium sp.]
MSIEGQRGSIPAGVYNGFSAPVRRSRPGAASRAGRILMGGVAAAAVLGAGFGLMAKPNERDTDGLMLRSDQVVQIEVGPGRVVEPAPIHTTAAPLQTLPPGTAVPAVVVARAAAPARSAPRPAPERADPELLPPPDVAPEPMDVELASAAENAGADAAELVLPPAFAVDE